MHIYNTAATINVSTSTLLTRIFDINIVKETHQTHYIKLLLNLFQPVPPPYAKQL